MRHVPQAVADDQGGADPPRAAAHRPLAGTLDAPPPGSLRTSAAQIARQGASVIEEISSGLEQPAAAQAPDLIEPIVAFRSWRVVDDRLRSVYLPVFWSEREIKATCLCLESPDPDAPRTAPPGHAAPDRGCTCGIYAYYEPDLNLPTVDYRGVTGIVSLWGTIELHPEGMRAEHARVEALALYSRWSRRQIDAVREVARSLSVDLVDLDEIEQAARRYGQHVGRDLVPGRARVTAS